MTKQEFLEKLAALLQDIPAEEREAALEFYRGYFDDAGEGREAEVIRELDKRSVPADTHRRRPAPNPSVYPPGQMTPSQINKCWRLIYSVCASDPSDVPPADRLAGAAERFIGQRPNMMAKNPFRFFTQEQGSKLIESLKRLEYSAEVKKLKRDRKE